MPDGKALIVWGEGKIWRAEVEGAKASVIPFTAKVEQTINDALRFPQKVYTPEFAVKMLRDVARRPTGSRLPMAHWGGSMSVRFQPAIPSRSPAPMDSHSIRHGRPTASRSSTRRGVTRLTDGCGS